MIARMTDPLCMDIEHLFIYPHIAQGSQSMWGNVNGSTLRVSNIQQAASVPKDVPRSIGIGGVPV